MTKETPIIFSDAMVRAILEDRKTQTRRVMKPQATLRVHDPYDPRLRCPYGKPGDMLWVKETWQASPRPELDWDTYREVPKGSRVPDAFIHTYYRADESQYFCGTWDDGGPYLSLHHQNLSNTEWAVLLPEKWNSSRFMPKWAARLWLVVKSVRVERLQDISSGDAADDSGKLHSPNQGYDPEQATIIEFQELWDSINAKRGYGWDTNPWVWAVEFERV